MVRSLWKQKWKNQLDFWGREVEREWESEKVLTWLQTGIYWTDHKRGHTELNTNGDILNANGDILNTNRAILKTKRKNGERESFILLLIFSSFFLLSIFIYFFFLLLFDFFLSSYFWFFLLCLFLRIFDFYLFSSYYFQFFFDSVV